jgi:hypothetical protein
MAGRYTGSYLDRLEGWRAVATLADIGRASLVERIPKASLRTSGGGRQPACGNLMAQMRGRAGRVAVIQRDSI